MVSKHAQIEMRRRVEVAVRDVCGLPRPGLWFCVDEVEMIGTPPERVKVWATIHFMAAGSPFCCGEPHCHLGLMGERLTRVGEHLRRSLGLRQAVAVEFGDRIAVSYHPGVVFTGGRESVEDHTE